MSDKPLEVGDLVKVVHSCCTPFVAGSPVFVISSFYQIPLGCTAQCIFCKRDITDNVMAWDGLASNERPGYPISWLKRIPPLDESEDVLTDEELSV